MRDKVLAWTAAGFGAAFLLHGADHLRRGLDASPASVAAIGAVQAVAIGIAVVMAWTARRGAPLAAMGVGTVSILLVVFGHLVPGGTDSFATPPATNVTALSWASAVLEIAAAATFAVAGLLVARREARTRADGAAPARDA